LKHTLHVTTSHNSTTVDASCSCGTLTMRNVSREDVRDQYAGHMQAVAGPDAQRKREVAHAI